MKITIRKRKITLSPNRDTIGRLVEINEPTLAQIVAYTHSKVITIEGISYQVSQIELFHGDQELEITVEEY